MDRKKFFLTAAVIVVAAVAGWVVKYRQPVLEGSADWASIPLQTDEWAGEIEGVSPLVLDMLAANSVFNANYFGSDGVQVNLFLGDWSGAQGGPHSPMNCLPASGWIVEEISDRPVTYGDRLIPARRVRLQHNQTFYLMDFWYITPFGETANDYQLKLYEMFTSLALQPRHLTFVRFVSRDSEVGRAVLDRFEQHFIPEIYDRLPVEAR